MSNLSYEVVYFQLPGRAEPIRQLLALAGVPFTDTRLDRDAWMARKPTTPLGQMPLLVERDGDRERVIPQTMAILRHLGRRFGLYGEGEDAMLATDVVAETALDLSNALNGLLFGPTAQDPEFRANFFANVLPVHLNRLDKLKRQSPGALFVGDGPTWADVMVFCTLGTAMHLKGDALADRAELAAFMGRMCALPNLSAWLLARG